MVITIITGQVVDSNVVFDALYSFLSPGSESAGPMPDAPADCFRIRLVREREGGEGERARARARARARERDREGER